MINNKNQEVWFVTGSQHLYGPETLKQVAADSVCIASSLDGSPKITPKIVFKPVLTTPDSITELCADANNSKNCIGSDRMDAHLFSCKNVDKRIIHPQ